MKEHTRTTTLALLTLAAERGGRAGERTNKPVFACVSCVD